MSHRIFIGNLSERCEKFELEEAVSKYGKLSDVWIARNPPGFAFVTFEDPRDAEDCVKGLVDKEIAGTVVRAEIAKNQNGGGMAGPRGRGGGGGGGGYGGGGYGGGSRTCCTLVSAV